jgi:hypothetical protein
MSAVVVYESMFGNTRKVAEAIARGLGTQLEPVVVPSSKATPESVGGAGLVVVGGPTHMHSMSRGASRRMAGEVAAKPDSGVTLEPDAAGDGLREWFASLGDIDAECAAFDTRLPGHATFTGSASKRIDQLLRRHGGRPASRPGSFIVAKDNTIAPEELARAEQWGAELARNMRSHTRT